MPAAASHWSECTIQKRDGSFCEQPSLPDAPYPICARHATVIYRYMRDVLAGPQIEDARWMDDLAAKIQTPTSPGRSVVYYVLSGEQIKIGTTTNAVRDRLADMPPGWQILAVEPGGRELETARHRQFRHIRIAMNREWFTPAPDLWRHIEGIRAEHGEPHERHDSLAS